MPSSRGRCPATCPELPRSSSLRFWPLRAFLVPWLVVSTLSGRAPAKEPDSIVLVHDAGQELLTARLRDELHALGWLVVEISESDDLQPLETLAERVHAFAGVHVARTGMLELWVAPVAGKPFREELRVDTTTDAEIAALRAVEVLRTRFLQLGFTPPTEAARASSDVAGAPVERRDTTGATAPPAATPPAPAKAEARPTPDAAGAPPPPALFRLGVAAGAATSPGGLGWYPVASAQFRILTAGKWSFGGGALVTLGGRTVEASQGSSDVRWSLLDARTEYSLLPARSVVGVALMGGLGAAIVQMDGSAEKPYQGTSDAVVALSARAGSVVSLPLSTSWAMRAELTGGVAAPRPVVRFAGETVAAWGRPFAAVTLGVEVGVGP
jgi:hypothetical protein